MALGRLSCLLLLLLACLRREAEAKVQSVTFKLGGAERQQRFEWKYTGKFGFGVGTGTYSARLREVGQPSLPPGSQLEMETYLDEEWPLAETVEYRCDRKQHARRVRNVNVGPAGIWGSWANGTIRQNVRPHVWYFAISDCNRTLKNGTYTFQFELEAKQEGGSHFSVELQWAPIANLLSLLGCSAFLFSFWRRSCRFFNSVGSLHPVIYTLGAILVVQFAAQALHTGHLTLYRWNGQGSRVMEVLSEVLFMLCQVIQTSLLVVIALGYTLLKSKLGDLDFALPVCGVVALVHIALVILDKAQDGAAHRFTDHDGATGWIFMVLRLGLYAWFLLAANSTATSGGFRLKAFLGKFRLAASLYFLAYPLTFLVMQLFAPYLREPVMEGGIMAAQVASNIWLASLFLDRGAYFEASSLSASPLPGGGSPVRFFKQE